MDVHQGSTLLVPLHHVDLLTGVDERAPQHMLFTDYIAQMGESYADLETQPGRLLQALHYNGLWISREKTELMTFQ